MGAARGRGRALSAVAAACSLFKLANLLPRCDEQVLAPAALRRPHASALGHRALHRVRVQILQRADALRHWGCN